MSDFYIDVGILRDQAASALCNNPEQLAYVLGEIAGNLRPEDLIEHDHMFEDPTKAGIFLRALADHLDPTGA